MTQPSKGVLAGLVPLVVIALAYGTAMAAPHQHAVLLGPWRQVSIAMENGKAISVKVRSLNVDARFKEYVAGPAHDITDRLFVIRKAVQLNDGLPQEANKSPRWIWRLESWISVDRQTGHVAQINLPLFDHESSELSWYRDLAAYCGTSDDGSKAYAMVFQLGRRKPLLKKELAGGPCSAPTWERQPTRVTFANAQGKSSFTVSSRSADLLPEAKDDEDESE